MGPGSVGSHDVEDGPLLVGAEPLEPDDGVEEDRNGDADDSGENKGEGLDRFRRREAGEKVGVVRHRQVRLT